MISSNNSLLSSGINKWFHPKPLIDSINGCVRTAASFFCGYDYLTSTEYKPYGRAKEGTISIKLTDIGKAYKHYASERSVADKSIVSGEREDGLWRVYGLPVGLVLIGKSPDSVDCLLSGVDFFYSEGAYFFKINPVAFGTLTSRQGEESVDYFYLGGYPTVSDFPQFNYTKYGVQTQGSDRLVSSVKSGGLSAFGGAGLLSAACTGRYASQESGKLEWVWTEGVCKIGLVANQLLYAGKDEKTRDFGAHIEPGDSLMLESPHIGAVLLDDGNASWVPGISDITSGVVSHSEVVLEEIHKDPGTHKFIEDYRPDTANNTIIQPIKVIGGNSLELADVEVAKIDKVWILYGNDADSSNKLNPHTGMLSAEVLCHATRSGGCIECSNIVAVSPGDGDGFIRVLTLGGVQHGAPMSYGSAIYSIALELVGGRIYKVINIYPAVTAVAQATPLVDIYLNKSFEVSEKEPLANDELSEYWLEVEQEVELFDLLDVL